MVREVEILDNRIRAAKGKVLWTRVAGFGTLRSQHFSAVVDCVSVHHFRPSQEAVA
jgi:hypothetical protein